MRKTDIDTFFTEAYESRDEYNSRGVNEIKYNLKPRNNAYGELVKKVQKMGHKKVISLKLDAEEVLGYTNLFIYEALLEYDGKLSDNNLNDYVSLYCYDRYNKLSRDNGINYDYHYDKRNGTYELIKTCEYSEGLVTRDSVMKDEASMTERSEGTNGVSEWDEARGFIREYITEEYLTTKQIEYCNTVLEYGPSKGKGIYDMHGNLLYTKQQANYYNNEIKAKLAQYLVQGRQ
jgi:hypothetical protein